PLFVLLFSRVFLRERIQSVLYLWIALAFGGLVLLVKPDLFQGWGRLPLFPVSVGISAAAFSALAVTAVRAATARVGVNIIIFYFTAASTLLSAPLLALHYVNPSPRQWVQIVFLAGCATFAQFAMTQGYRFAAAGIV